MFRGLSPSFFPGPVYMMRLILLLLSVFCCRGEELITRLSGSDVTFQADVSFIPSEINWLKDNSLFVELIQGRDPHFYRWKDRVIADLEQKRLILRNVTLDDSGLYVAEVLDSGGSVSPKSFRLRVYDHVCAVIIQDIALEDNVTLNCTCSAPGAAPFRYIWYNSSDHQVSDQQNITVYREKRAQQYTCNASNAVSWNNATITVQPRTDNKVKRSHLPIIAGFISSAIVSIISYFLCRRDGDPKEKENQLPKEVKAKGDGDPKEKENQELNPGHAGDGDPKEKENQELNPEHAGDGDPKEKENQELNPEHAGEYKDLREMI